MPTPSSYPLTIADIQAEFGSSINTSGECLGLASGVPNSYPLTSGDLLGISNIVETQVTVTEGTYTYSVSGGTTKNPTVTTHTYWGYTGTASNVAQPPSSAQGSRSPASANGASVRGAMRYRREKTNQTTTFDMQLHVAGDRRNDLVEVYFQGDNQWRTASTGSYNAVKNTTDWSWNLNIATWNGSGTRWVKIRSQF